MKFYKVNVARMTSTMLTASLVSLVSLISNTGCLSLASTYRDAVHVERYDDIAYQKAYLPKEKRDQKNMLDVYMPDQTIQRQVYQQAYQNISTNNSQGTNPQAANTQINPSIPVVFFVHGGSWYSGDRKYYEAVTGLYSNVGVAMAREGIGSVVISYHLHPDAPLSEQLDDVAAALLWTKAHIREYGGDADNIVVMGHSAGAHLLTTLFFDDNELQKRKLSRQSIRGLIGLGGVYDIPDMWQKSEEEYRVKIVESVFGKTTAEQEVYSPLHILRRRMLMDVGPIDLPTMFVTADQDYATCRAAWTTLRSEVEVDHKPYFTVAPQFYDVTDYDHNGMVLRAGTPSDQILPLAVTFMRTITSQQRAGNGQVTSK